MAIPTAIPEEPLQSRFGNLAWKYGRLFFRFIVVGNHLDSFFVEVFHQLNGSMGQARFGITHSGWRVAVDGAEVPLSID